MYLQLRYLRAATFDLSHIPMQKTLRHGHPGEDCAAMQNDLEAAAQKQNIAKCQSMPELASLGIISGHLRDMTEHHGILSSVFSVIV
jgi:hypothetical protein